MLIRIIFEEWRAWGTRGGHWFWSLNCKIPPTRIPFLIFWFFKKILKRKIFGHLFEYNPVIFNPIVSEYSRWNLVSLCICKKCPYIYFRSWVRNQTIGRMLEDTLNYTDDRFVKKICIYVRSICEMQKFNALVSFSRKNT